jgi:hypothetical protein
MSNSFIKDRLDPPKKAGDKRYSLLSITTIKHRVILILFINNMSSATIASIEFKMIVMRTHICIITLV